MAKKVGKHARLTPTKTHEREPNGIVRMQTLSVDDDDLRMIYAALVHAEEEGVRKQMLRKQMFSIDMPKKQLQSLAERVFDGIGKLYDAERR